MRQSCRLVTLEVRRPVELLEELRALQRDLDELGDVAGHCSMPIDSGSRWAIIGFAFDDFVVKKPSQ
jgi:hypothetical protein